MKSNNFAAQAERSLFETYAKLNNEKIIEADKRGILNLSYKISKAVHFQLPDNGLIFDDELKGLKDQKIRLPFPKITVSYFSHPETKFG